MSRFRHPRIVVGTAFVLLVALLLWLHSCTNDSVQRFGGTGGQDFRTSSPITITGQITRPISPGEMVALDLAFTNPNDVTIAIDQGTVGLASLDAPRAEATRPCSQADLDFRPLADAVIVTVPARATETLSGLGVPEQDRPALGMHDRPVNQDGCKGATLTLRYQASGQEVTR